MRDMTHMTMHLYKGKWNSFWVHDDPWLVINVTISHREKGITVLNYYETLYENSQLKETKEQHSCSIEEFEELLREKYLFDIGSVLDGGDVDGYLIH